VVLNHRIHVPALSSGNWGQINYLSSEERPSNCFSKKFPPSSWTLPSAHLIKVITKQKHIDLARTQLAIASPLKDPFPGRWAPDWSSAGSNLCKVCIPEPLKDLHNRHRCVLGHLKDPEILWGVHTLTKMMDPDIVQVCTPDPLIWSPDWSRQTHTWPTVGPSPPDISTRWLKDIKCVKMGSWGTDQ
jgi:hypothetical protein